MNKEYLEALEVLKTALHNEWLRFYPQLEELDEKTKFVDGVRMVGSDADAFLTVKQALNRLEAIDDANPNEALKDLEILKSHISARDMLGETNKKIALDICNDVEKALLKYQELEKEKLLFKNIHNTKVKTPLVSIFEGLSKDERFKFTEHLYYHWEGMKEALEEQNEQLTKENIELKKKLNKPHITWDDLTFPKEPTYIKATLNGVMVTIKCWKEYSKEWCTVNFGNASCNNMVFVHHGYDDETDTQTTIFDGLGLVRA